MDLLGKVNKAINFPSAPRPSGGRSMTNMPGRMAGGGSPGGSVSSNPLATKMSSADRVSFGAVPRPGSMTAVRGFSAIGAEDMGKGMSEPRFESSFQPYKS